MADSISWKVIFVLDHTVLTRMSQTERPQSQVGRRVGNAAETVLYCVDRLVQKRLSQVKLKFEDDGDFNAAALLSNCHQKRQSKP